MKRNPDKGNDMYLDMEVEKRMVFGYLPASLGYRTVHAWGWVRYTGAEAGEISKGIPAKLNPLDLSWRQMVREAS